MSTEILDQAQDLTGAEWHRLTATHTVPEFVKSASHPARYGDPAELPVTVYAYPPQRLYPCHTAAATWASAMFFLEKQANWKPAENEAIWTRLQDAARYWQILPQVQALTGERTKSAAAIPLADDDFALVWELEGQPKERHYPLRNAEEVKAAAAWLEQFRGDMVLADRRTIAGRILTKAAAYHVLPDNNEFLCRTAGVGYCTTQTLVDCWQTRATLSKQTHPEYAAQANGMAESIKIAHLDFRDHGLRCRLADLMDTFDRETKLAALYGDGLERPEDQIFQITEKVAKDTAKQYVGTTCGTVYEKTAMELIPLEDIRGWLGDDIAEAVSIAGIHVDTEKLAAVITTLPRPDAQMFDQLAASLGIVPFAQAKMANACGLSGTAAAELAGEYAGQCS